MTIKQMIFVGIVFIMTNSCMPSEHSAAEAALLKADFVFDGGIITFIEDNDIWTYLNFERQQRHATPVFKDIKVVEFTKNKEFQEVGTLGSLEKANRTRTKDIALIRSVANGAASTKSYKTVHKPEVFAQF